MSSFVLKVFGCQMNTYDGDRLRTALEEAGWREDEDASADAVIFLTCSIRDKAEQKVWSTLGRYAESWKDHRRPLVAVLGCMAQRVGEELFRRFPWVRVVSGPRHLGRVPRALEDVLQNGGRHLLLDEDPRALEDLDAPPCGGRTPTRPSCPSPTAVTISAPTASFPMSGGVSPLGIPEPFWTKSGLWWPTAFWK